MMRKYVEMNVVALAAIILLSMPFMPSSSAQFSPSPSPTGFAPAPSPTGLEADCLKEIEACIVAHVQNNESDPQFDQTSSSFNVTAFLCCSLIQETATIEKDCFCNVNTFVQQNPRSTESTGIIQTLTFCGIVNSVAALDTFCLGEAASPTAIPLVPSPGNS